MQEFLVELSDNEFRALNHSHPDSGKSACVGARAVAIVCLYAQKMNWKESPKRRGVDLAFTSANGALIELEVKGTAAKGMQMQKLGVSGNPCYINLKNGMPLYRVSSVFTKTPTIHVMMYEIDYTMKTEKRWKIQRVNSKA